MVLQREWWWLAGQQQQPLNVEQWKLFDDATRDSLSAAFNTMQSEGRQNGLVLDLSPSPFQVWRLCPIESKNRAELELRGRRSIAGCDASMWSPEEDQRPPSALLRCGRLVEGFVQVRTEDAFMLGYVETYLSQADAAWKFDDMPYPEHPRRRVVLLIESEEPEIPRTLSSQPLDEDERNIISAFQAYDVNGDGSIERGELQRIMEDLDPAFSTEEGAKGLKKMLDTVDTTRSGVIDMWEFLRFISDMGEGAEVIRTEEPLIVTVEAFLANGDSLPAVHLAPCITVLEAKRTLEPMAGMPAAEMQLFTYSAQELADPRTLAEERKRLSDSLQALQLVRKPCATPRAGSLPSSPMRSPMRSARRRQCDKCKGAGGHQDMGGTSFWATCSTCGGTGKARW